MNVFEDTLPAAFLDDPVAKFEFRAARTRQVLDGERALMFAVLMDALDTYSKTRRGRSYRHRLEFREVQSWIASESTATPFTFVNICDALRINPDAVRTLLKSRDFAERNPMRRFRHIATNRDIAIQALQNVG